MSQLIELTYIKEVSRKSVEGFFTIFYETLEKYQIKPKNIYNMDETNIRLRDILKGGFKDAFKDGLKNVFEDGF